MAIGMGIAWTYALDYTAMIAFPFRDLTSSHGLSLHAEDLPKLGDDLNEIGLRGHDGIDILIGPGCLIDDICILATLDSLGCLNMIGKGKRPLRLTARHPPTRAV